MAKVFNYSRTVSVGGVLEKTKQFVEQNNESYPWKTEDTSLGLHMKITYETAFKTFLSHQSYEFMQTLFQFHNPFEFPFHRDPQYFSQNDQDLLFLIELDVTELDETLRDYPLERRQCYLNDEKSLKFFKIYSENNCMQECLSNFTLKTCGCVQFYMIRKKFNFF